MEHFKNKAELCKAVAGKSIVLWTGGLFIRVTRKALLDAVSGNKTVSGAYEHDGPFVRLSIYQG